MMMRGETGLHERDADCDAFCVEVIPTFAEMQAAEATPPATSP